MVRLQEVYSDCHSSSVQKVVGFSLTMREHEIIPVFQFVHFHTSKETSLPFLIFIYTGLHMCYTLPSSPNITVNLTRKISVVTKNKWALWNYSKLKKKKNWFFVTLFRFTRGSIYNDSRTTNWVLLGNYFHVLVLVIFSSPALVSWIILNKGHLVCICYSLDNRKIDTSKIQRPLNISFCLKNCPFSLNIETMVCHYPSEGRKLHL